MVLVIFENLSKTIGEFLSSWQTSVPAWHPAVLVVFIFHNLLLNRSRLSPQMCIFHQICLPTASEEDIDNLKRVCHSNNPIGLRKSAQGKPICKNYRGCKKCAQWYNVTVALVKTWCGYNDRPGIVRILHTLKWSPRLTALIGWLLNILTQPDLTLWQ